MGSCTVKINILEPKTYTFKMYTVDGYSLHICLPRHKRVHGWGFLWKVCISTHVGLAILDCLYDRHVTGPSVHPLHDSACLSVSLKWSCLVSQTVKGWRQKLSRNAVLVCKNKPSGQRYLKRIYIKQLQKQASVNVDRWCNETTP